MFITKESYAIYLRWLAVAQEFMVADEDTLVLVAQWVANEQKDRSSAG